MYDSDVVHVGTRKLIRLKSVFSEIQVIKMNSSCFPEKKQGLWFADWSEPETRIFHSYLCERFRGYSTSLFRHLCLSLCLHLWCSAISWHFLFRPDGIKTLIYNKNYSVLFIVHYTEEFKNLLVYKMWLKFSSPNTLCLNFTKNDVGKQDHKYLMLRGEFFLHSLTFHFWRRIIWDL